MLTLVIIHCLLSNINKCSVTRLPVPISGSVLDCRMDNQEYVNQYVKEYLPKEYLRRWDCVDGIPAQEN